MSESKELSHRIGRVLKKYDMKELGCADLNFVFHIMNMLDFNQVINEQVILDRGIIPPYLDFVKAIVEPSTSLYDSFLCDPLNDEPIKKFVADLKKKITPKLDEVRQVMDSKNRVVSEAKEVLKSVCVEISNYFGGPKVTKSITEKTNEKAKAVKKENGNNTVKLSDVAGFGTSEPRALLFKVVMDELKIPCRLMRGTFENKLKGEEDGEKGEGDEEEAEGEEEETEKACTYCQVLMFDKLFHIDLARKAEPFSKKEEVECYTSKGRASRVREGEWDMEIEKTISKGSFSCLKVGTPKDEERKGLFGNSVHQKVCVREINFKFKTFGAVKLRHLFRRHVCLTQLIQDRNIVEYLGHYREKEKGIIYARFYENCIDGKKFLDVLAESTDNGHKIFCEVLIVILKIASAMRYIHQLGLVFFALPLSKVLVEWDEEKKQVAEVRLRICNLSLLRRQQEDMLRNFNRKYCASEVLEGMRVLSAEQDPYTWKIQFKERIDVYSLGKMMQDFVNKFPVIRGYALFSDLMFKCLNENPSERPTTDHVIYVIRTLLAFLKRLSDV